MDSEGESHVRRFAVATAQPWELADKQRQAATEIQSGVEVADGVETSMLLTHGLIAWSTAAVVEAVQNARRAAGSGTKGVAEEMADKLDASAGTYDRIDGMAGGRLGGRMQTR